MRQYVDEAEEITADSSRCCHNGREEEKIALIDFLFLQEQIKGIIIIVVLVVVELLFDGGIESTIDVVVSELPWGKF